MKSVVKNRKKRLRRGKGVRHSTLGWVSPHDVRCMTVRSPDVRLDKIFPELFGPLESERHLPPPSPPPVPAKAEKKPSIFKRVVSWIRRPLQRGRNGGK